MKACKRIHIVIAAAVLLSFAPAAAFMTENTAPVSAPIYSAHSDDGPEADSTEESSTENDTTGADDNETGGTGNGDGADSSSDAGSGGNADSEDGTGTEENDELEDIEETESDITADIEIAGSAMPLPPGWISGDIHTHSRNSDGTGTVAQNFAAGSAAGMGFIVIADHDNSAGWSEAQTEGARTGIIPIRGNEYSGMGHAVFMNIDREYNYNQGRFPKQAVALMKEHTGGRGLAYASHPYDGTGHPDPWGLNDSWNAAIDGIEVWSGWYAARYPANVQAFEKWDELNRDGRRLYGVAGTDTHSAAGTGAVYTTVYARGYTNDGIIEGFARGNMYGSNGPVIDFRAGGVMMGETARIQSGGESVSVSMSGAYTEELARVILIKNGSVIHTQNINAASFEITVDVDAEPGDFIRMELEGRETGGKSHIAGNYSTPSFTQSAPFAFSNPIFFEEEPGDFLYGDANGDGRVNGTDVQALILWINAGRPHGRIDELAAYIADEGIFNPRPHLNSVMELVLWINAGGKSDEGYPMP